MDCKINYPIIKIEIDAWYSSMIVPRRLRPYSFCAKFLQNVFENASLSEWTEEVEVPQ